MFCNKILNITLACFILVFSFGKINASHIIVRDGNNQNSPAVFIKNNENVLEFCISDSSYIDISYNDYRKQYYVSNIDSIFLMNNSTIQYNFDDRSKYEIFRRIPISFSLKLSIEHYIKRRFGEYMYKLNALKIQGLDDKNKDDQNYLINFSTARDIISKYKNNYSTINNYFTIEYEKLLRELNLNQLYKGHTIFYKTSLYRFNESLKFLDIFFNNPKCEMNWGPFSQRQSCYLISYNIFCPSKDNDVTRDDENNSAVTLWCAHEYSYCFCRVC